MKGYIMIEELAMRSKKDFDYWIQLAIDFNTKAKASKKRQKKK
jgi:TfoX/Sxy family transcriptional regulator of competence genes